MWILYSIPVWLATGIGWYWPMLGATILTLSCTVGIAWVIWRYQRILKKYRRD